MDAPFPPLTELLPHRPPMLLLRGILHHAPMETVCKAFFDADFARLLGDENAVPAVFGLELIAQTMAVHDGLRRRAEGRARATRGLLLGSRRFELLAPALPVGEILRVIATGEAGEPTPAALAGLVRFSGRVEDGAGRVLARGDVTVLEHRPAAPETALA